MVNMEKSSLTRRSLLLASALGFLAVPAHAQFIPPKHRHIPRIEARLKQWRSHVQAQHDLLLSSKDFRVAAWRDANAALVDTPDSALLEGANRLINRKIIFRTDYNVWKTRDHWATLVDALQRGGDCEDYALAKATTLTFHGLPETHYHLVIGNIHRGAVPEAHAILVVERDDGTFWALDNLTERVLPAEHMDMTPLYGVDSQGVWLFTRP